MVGSVTSFEKKLIQLPKYAFSENYTSFFDFFCKILQFWCIFSSRTQRHNHAWLKCYLI